MIRKGNCNIKTGNVKKKIFCQKMEIPWDLRKFVDIYAKALYPVPFCSFVGWARGAGLLYILIYIYLPHQIN